MYKTEHIFEMAQIKREHLFNEQCSCYETLENLLRELNAVVYKLPGSYSYLYPFLNGPFKIYFRSKFHEM